MISMDKKLENRLAILAIGIVALVITSAIIYQNSTHHILGNQYQDVFYYLIEALKMSGVEIDGYRFVGYLPPFVPFLTSILFRLGFVSSTSIIITSGIFFFVGIMGMFYLLRLRFNNFYSFFGAFLYATMFINIRWVANGTLDIAFVAVMVWALYFFIQAMEKNQKYFYIAFPLAVLCFFTKYVGAISVGVMVLYFMSRTNIASNIKKYYRNLLGGVLAGILTSVPFFAYFMINEIPLGFINQAASVSSQSSRVITYAGRVVHNDLFFYINSITYNISSGQAFIGNLILIVAIIGVILITYMFLKTFRDSYMKIRDMDSSIYKWTVPSKLMFALLAISIVMVLASFFTASKFSFFYSELILFAGMYLLAYSLTKIIINFDGVDNIWLSTYPYLAINIAMAGLFLAYLIFFSAHITKTNRYFTSMAPGFVFLIVFAVEILLNRFKSKVKYVVPIVIMLLMLSICWTFVIHIEDDPVPVSEQNAANWLDGKEGIVFSNRGYAQTWYLQKNVFIPGNIGNATLLNKELLNGNATYYVSSGGTNLTDYSLVQEFNAIKIYKRN